MQKTIQINPDFLQITKKKLKKKKKNKNHSLKAKDIKKQLLKKIKDHQIKSQEALKLEKKKVNPESASLEDEFKMSLSYLNKISDEKKKKKERKKRQKKQAQTQPIKKSNTKDDPPFGVLKGGKKPLYRDYMRTLKNKKNLSPEKQKNVIIHDGGISKMGETTERQKKLKKLRKKVKKRNFTIGKNAKKRRIGVLIKNKTLRKAIEDKKNTLKEIHIHDVKKYLRKRGLIRVGTVAPNDVTRTMFEDANSAGNIYNRSPEVLLYNYLNDK